METERRLSRHLSPLGAWAFAIGTSIGWGSLVVTSNTYLAQAGPWGSALGMVLGGLIMLIISYNYAYLMNIYPDAGGAYTYTREVFGHDYGFLTAWFLSLTYLAMLWANATSIPLFARYFIGNTFKVGRLYVLFGYDVYLGEALLSTASLLIVALLCSNFRNAVAKAMIAMGLVFSAAITVCFAAAILGHGGRFTPDFVPDTPALSQIVKIAVISPWAFIGFENISHATEEMNFKRTGMFRVLLVTIITTTLLYIFVTLLSATAYPPEYASWLDYIRDCGNLDGIKGLPAFYAASHYLGQTGVTILMLALLCLILTSLVGNTFALSRLFCALGRDRILPASIAKLNRKDIPGNAIWLVIGVSAFFPFLGRTAIGWIVDVTTIGATLIYGLVSASAMKLAHDRRDRREHRVGLTGLAIMIAFGLYLLVPNLFTTGTMARESYFFFIVWAVLGFGYFRMLLQRDKQRRFGNSIVVWIALFSMILFVSLVYLSQSIMGSVSESMDYIEQFYARIGADASQFGLVEDQMRIIRRTSALSLSAVLILIAVSMSILIGTFRKISMRAQSSELQLGLAREMANRDPLTGVKSRHAYADKERALDEQIAGGSAEPFAIVVCDLNGLKFYNDEYGHKAGDERIKQASKLICDFFSHSPVFRNGGDEFVVYLTGRDYEERDAIMTALHDKSEANIATDDIVVSAGLAAFEPGSDLRVHSVFERADAAMYREKMLLKSRGAKTR